MDYMRPVCGKMEQHDPHGACQGWTSAQVETARLIDTLMALARVLRDQALSADDVKLECHPAAVNALRQMVLPDFSGAGFDDPLKPSIPIMASTSKMERGEWRIVLADGKIV